MSDDETVDDIDETIRFWKRSGVRASDVYASLIGDRMVRHGEWRSWAAVRWMLIRRTERLDRLAA